jgi:demethylmenaquinone methyltransferase/2-methoxy-6-polyprenyl-1,4-benzoquinol methylase
MNHVETKIDKSSQRVQRMFGEIAPRYDLLNHLLSMNVDRYWRWRTVRLAPPENSGPILDVCTGTGDLAIAYYRRASGNVSVVGTDFCSEMLEIGETKKRRIGADGRLRFVEADTENLPFSDDFFQLVTVAFGLRNVANTDDGLREMVRVCRSGGRVVVLEFSMPERQPLKALYRGYFRAVLPRIGQFVTKNREDAYRYLPESVAQFPSGLALVRRMEDAGLDDIVFRPMTLGIATIYIGLKK